MKWLLNFMFDLLRSERWSAYEKSEVICSFGLVQAVESGEGFYLSVTQGVEDFIHYKYSL